MERSVKTDLSRSPTGNRAAAEILLYASLVALALGRKLVQAFRPAPIRGVRRVLPPERWSAVVRSVMPGLLDVLLGPPPLRRALERRLALVLEREAPDPNRKRLLPCQRAEAGVLRVASSQS